MERREAPLCKLLFLLVLVEHMKHHHFRKEYKELVQGLFVRKVVTYCGMMFCTEAPETQDYSAPPNESAIDHCRRCLIGKRKAKGDEYMLKHGYPLITHPHKGVKRK